MASQSDCNVNNFIPEEVTYVYIIASVLCLVALAVYSYSDRREQELQDYQITAHYKGYTFDAVKASNKDVIVSKTFVKDLWKKKKCFFPFLSHIFDQATDLGVILGLIEMAKLEWKDKIDCDGINTIYLSVASVFVFVFYRIVSSVAIYYGIKQTANQKTSKRALIFAVGQLLDLMLFRAIWVNYKLNLDAPCSPQKWLQNLEAMYVILRVIHRS